MIQITGIITEKTEGEEVNSITITQGKAKSKIKFTPMQAEIEDFQIGEKLTVVIEKEATLFDKPEKK